ncbi:Plant self-incompatibility S1 [Dillenia turbinata]|uniref:S-protein homolog n=1 Tax=Dillenia turbinata TaxID=194707 RepID=A0AAN8VNK0_9MAGN
METTLCAMAIVLVFANLGGKAMGDQIQVRIQNQLGEAMNIKIHCQTREKDLGSKVIAKGEEIEWRTISTKQGLPYYCDVEWNEGNGFRFKAFSSSKGGRCQSECFWGIREGGPLLLNQHKGTWDLMPFNPLPV